VINNLLQAQQNMEAMDALIPNNILSDYEKNKISSNQQIAASENCTAKYKCNGRR